MTCLGCNHIETAPHKLRTGRTVCATCPNLAEEDAAVARHVENLDRAHGRVGRAMYLETVRAREGAAVAIAVESEYLRQWKARQAG